MVIDDLLANIFHMTVRACQNLGTAIGLKKKQDRPILDRISDEKYTIRGKFKLLVLCPFKRNGIGNISVFGDFLRQHR